MIPVQRLPATNRLVRLCDSRTEKIRKLGATSEAARDEWRLAEAAKSEIRALLEKMAPGVLRCMYCLDSLGTDIDHFEPLSRTPLRTFCWHNHLLACSRCNSNFKREDYPCDEETGECLLIDPSADDPADHLELLVAIGKYEGKTRKGKESIRVFGLNRKDLMEGRFDAYITSCDVLNSWHRKVLRGDLEGAARSAAALRREPFGDVLRALEKLGRLPYAAAALGDELAESVSAWLHRLPHQAATTSQPHVGSDDALAR
ncbi:hypothetical protein HEP86_22695 [Streptomyces sp. RPA4-5]|uniref:hypothetical protein n=1 Tax=Streptomyces sp. RPA4-5 TaxID=2721245 RepID=UPI00143E1250|nr:hypothetical protein [Streptomyces sp. RPA4-5]QIY56820.1 hypothetical protein HEP86_22695 [Streptomyces sp. RPA4-5]